ncbi:MAG: carbohydrate-binding domain-containing protein [Bacteroidales bacterium]|nr:carbohydrate-binding domain-containing protein [Bacteroidales bacterium]
MKRYILTLVSLIVCLQIFPQQNRIFVHRYGQILLDTLVSDVDSIKFDNGSSSYFHLDGNSISTFPIAGIDSITFGTESPAPNVGNIVYIIYNQTNVTVINPYANNGVVVTVNGTEVDVVSTAGLQDIEYNVSGTASNGYLTLTSDNRFTLTLAGVTLTNPNGPAIDVLIDHKVSVMLAAGTTSTLTDGGLNVKKAAFQSKGELVFNGTGTLNVAGKKMHGIFSNDYIRVINGNINVTEALNDGLHGDYFQMYGGTVKVTSTGDGIDGGKGFIDIKGGSITVTTTGTSAEGIKCDSVFNVSGGTIDIAVNGDESKGFKSGQNMTLKGGVITITASGNTVIDSGQTSYCSGIKCDGNLTIDNPSNITITLPSTNKGGKGITADGDITVNGGMITITTAGDGGTYTDTNNITQSYASICMKTNANLIVSGGTLDCKSTGMAGKCLSADLDVNITGGYFTLNTTGAGGTYTLNNETEYFTASCIKSDGFITITGGNINCTSTGKGGKGIAGDSTFTMGLLGANDSLVTINITTTGEAMGSSSGGGGGWNPWSKPPGPGPQPPSESSSGGNPKGLKIYGKIIINSGRLNVSAANAEPIESKTYYEQNGGDVETVSQNDDAINVGGTCSQSKTLVVNGGRLYAYSSGNDAIDCNGNIEINGGVVIGHCAKGQPEVGMDACEGYDIIINGGVVLVSGPNSSGQFEGPASSSQQKSVKATVSSVSSGKDIKITTNSGTEILTYKVPALSTTIGMILSAPEFNSNSTVTIYYGGTINGGTHWHNYYDKGTATYSGGSSKTLTPAANGGSASF